MTIVVYKLSDFPTSQTMSAKEGGTKPNLVVIGMDDSKHSDYAFKWYIDNVHKENNRVLLVHAVKYKTVTNTAMGVMSESPAIVIKEIEKEEKEMVRLAEKWESQLEASKLDGEVVRVSGEPGHAILHLADERGADLIVVGCRGSGIIRTTLMGSVSNYIMHHAHVPVFVCRHKDSHPEHHHHFNIFHRHHSHDEKKSKEGKSEHAHDHHRFNLFHRHHSHNEKKHKEEEKSEQKDVKL